MPKLKDLQKDLDYLSSQISTQIRTYAIGILVFIWGLIISIKTQGIDNVGIEPYLYLSGLFVIILLFLDYLQYLFGFKYTKILFDQLESDKDKDEIKFEAEHILYRARMQCFRLKQYSLYMSVSFLIIALLKLLY